MTKIVATHTFSGRPDDAPVARLIKEGEELIGDLAKVALLNGWAAEVAPEAPAAAPKKGRK